MALENRSIVMTGLEDLPGAPRLVRAEVRDGMGTITEIDVEFVAGSQEIALSEVLERVVSLGVETEAGGMVRFTGHCTEIAFQGQLNRQGFYFMRLSAWPWYLTQTTDCRIFEGLTTPQILTAIARDFGFDAALEFALSSSETPAARPYCVQYRESAFAFLYRLMAEDGLNFYLRHEPDRAVMVVVNSPSKLPDLPGDPTLRFRYKDRLSHADTDVVYEWRAMQSARSARVALGEFDYWRARSNIGTRETVPSSGLAPAFERYDYPGRYLFDGDDQSRGDDGERRAAVRAEAIESEIRRAQGTGNARRLLPGHRFRLAGHERAAANAQHTVLRSIHQLQIDTDHGEGELDDTLLVRRAALPPLPLQRAEDAKRTGAFERYRVSFEVQPGDAPVRLAQDCPRPSVPGLQTATVISETKGKEVDTDELGRIKVRFHWSRERGASDSAVKQHSCRVRTALPWTGSDYGMFFVPRVGQEVVVQFEEGDPDRPMVVGMLYNGARPLPRDTAELETQTGLRTRSTEGGTSRKYNQLLFDDAIGAERIDLRAQKDFDQTVLNDLTIDVGTEAEADGGNLTTTVERDIATVSKTGDRSTEIRDGNDSLEVAKDRSVAVEGKSSHAATGDLSVSTEADASHSAAGKMTLTARGDASYSTEAKMTITAAGEMILSAPTITISGDTEVKIAAGGTTVTIDAGGIELQGGQIKHNP